MAILIKQQRLSGDPWRKIEDPAVLPYNASSFSLLPLQAFVNLSECPTELKRIGVWFSVDTEPTHITRAILKLPLLCIETTDFNDGRTFTLASIIKQQLGYQGELRASGNLLLEQLPYLSQCGIDSFSLPDQCDWEYALFMLRQEPGLSRFHHTQ